VGVKPDERERFPKAIEVDATSPSRTNRAARASTFYRTSRTRTGTVAKMKEKSESLLIG